MNHQNHQYEPPATCMILDCKKENPQKALLGIKPVTSALQDKKWNQDGAVLPFSGGGTFIASMKSGHVIVVHDLPIQGQFIIISLIVALEGPDFLSHWRHVVTMTGSL